MSRRLSVLIAALAAPAACYASDATGLFVLLFGVPSLLLSVVFAAVSLKAPRGGATLCGMLLISEVPLVFWANRAGYMDSAGWSLTLSIAIATIGLFIALAKLVWPAKRQAPNDGDP